MKEIRLTKLIKAIALGNIEEKYYFNTDNYMIYSINQGQIRYMDMYRIATVHEDFELKKHSVRLPAYTEKDCMKEFMEMRGILEEYSYSMFERYLHIYELEEEYEKFKVGNYYKLAVAFCEENALVYIDDVKH